MPPGGWELLGLLSRPAAGMEEAGRDRHGCSIGEPVSSGCPRMVQKIQVSPAKLSVDQ